MKEQEKLLLKNKIQQAKLISFDVFDTLLFRKTNNPETVFDIVGRHFNIHGFRKLRMDTQQNKSVELLEKYNYPHANMEEIYQALAENTDIAVDWEAVKEYEIQVEKDALVANNELLEIFLYAKQLGKRVVAVSDMYLMADTLKNILAVHGFGEIDYVYCSADERKAKFNKELFEHVAKKENIAYKDILHIGDKERDDGEYPASFGMDTFVYTREKDLEKLKDIVSSDVDKGLYKILYNEEKDFWYNLGAEVGGPIYMGLHKFVQQKAGDKKIFFLSRDGYNLYHIFKKQGYENIEYLYTSRRSLLLASITEMNDEDIETLPPYTTGQTVGEILGYLCVDREKIIHLADAGFDSFDSQIEDEDDIENFKKLYLLNKEVFLERCKLERHNALDYFNRVGLFEQDAICFDCGWQGSSQILLERFKKAVGLDTGHYFLYFGIRSSEKSQNQLKGMHYDTYRFDFYKNYPLQYDAMHNVVLYELFFSAPHESVFYYGENGRIVFEPGNGDITKDELLAGILDFITVGRDFVEKYDIEYTPEMALGHLRRLINIPTETEAVTIGNLGNVDGFARKEGQEKYIAYITPRQIDSLQLGEIYWLSGLLKRPDVDEYVKRTAASRFSRSYPENTPRYALEAEHDVRTYHRWLENHPAVYESNDGFEYRPFFSVVIPVYNTASHHLEECFHSVLSQTYKNFELILVDDCSTWGNVLPVLQKYEQNEKVTVIYRKTNGHISVATNDGINVAKGDFIVFMDCDDTIEPDALYHFAKKLNENPQLDFIYSDEDKLTEDSLVRHMPFFKPDWSPDLFLNMMYTNHLAAYRTSVVKQTGALRTAYNGAQDYDFTLRFMEHSDNSRVGHIPKILYHWRERKESIAFAMSSKNYAAEATRNAKEDYIHRNNLNAYMEYIPGLSQYRIVYDVTGNPLVSIIIPSKDNPEILKQCIDSVTGFTDYKNYEIIVIDNGSNDENRAVIQAYLADAGAVYIYDRADFNFSKMCNTGAAVAKGDYLLFLNDDMELFQPDWLRRMLGQAQQPHTGAVGVKLFYPGTVDFQHDGIYMRNDGPAHRFPLANDTVAHYFGFNWLDCDSIAVTGACLMVSAEKFREIGCFDESYPVAYNDMKLCFDLYSRGYYNVIRNDVVAYHHESYSRGIDTVHESKTIRLEQDKHQLFTDYPQFNGKEPFMSCHMNSYQATLNLKNATDRLMKIDLSGCIYEENGSVDRIDIGREVSIIGWSKIDGQDFTRPPQRYVVFKDPYGETYAAKAQFYSRPDVADFFGIDAPLYLGFETLISRDELHVDMFPYDVGILTIDSAGGRHLKWCGNIRSVRAPQPVFYLPQPQQLSEYEPITADATYSIDLFAPPADYWQIRGFAYLNRADHYNYKKSVVLLAENGTAYSFEIQPEDRPDAAVAAPHIHFIRGSGFVCSVFNSFVVPGCYKLIIHMENQFGSQEVFDIITDKIIEI